MAGRSRFRSLMAEGRAYEDEIDSETYAREMLELTTSTQA